MGLSMQVCVQDFFNLQANGQPWFLLKVWALGVTVLIAGNSFVWNQGLEAGLLGFWVLEILAGASFTCLLLCISETLSGLPFNGGAFVMVRCSVGFFPGFIIGCTEACYFILTACLNVQELASIIASSFCQGAYWAHACLCICIYVLISCSMIQKKSSAFFWNFTVLLAFVSLLLTFISCFGVLGTPTVSSTITQEAHKKSISKTLNSFQSVTWLYTGIECLAFVSNMVAVPRQLIAKGFCASLTTMFVTNIFVILTTLYMYDDIDQLKMEAFPLNKGFVRVFKCTNEQATLLSIPAVFASSFGAVFAYSKLLASLAESGLFPSFLAHSTEAGSPFTSIIFGALISFCGNLIIDFSPSVSTSLGNLCFLTAYITYCAYGISYIVLKRRYSGSIDFSFKSPFGVGGALFFICVFACGIIFIGLSQGMPFLFLAILWTSSAAYYFGHAKNQQKFSTNEQTSIFLLKRVAFVKRYKGINSKTKRNSKSIKKPAVVCVAPKNKEPDPLNGVICSAASAKLQNPSLYLKEVHEILVRPADAKTFREKARAAFCAENVDFCLSVIEYRHLVDDILKQGTMYDNLDSMHSSFLNIINSYIADGSPNEVNISFQQKKNILKFFNPQDFSSLHL